MVRNIIFRSVVQAVGLLNYAYKFFCFYLIIMIKADLFTRMVKLLLINVEFQ